jgi:hypothetical protein
MLWRDALVMYDRASSSLWTQITGEAVAGPMKGRKLDELPSEMTTWRVWKAKHPDTLVLDKPPLAGSHYAGYHGQVDRIGVLGTKNPDERLGGKVLVLGLELEGKFAAIPFEKLGRRKLHHTSVGGVPVVIVSSSAKSADVWIARVAGRGTRFKFAPREGRVLIEDEATGGLWSPETGEAVGGATQARKLERVKVLTVYWGVWAQYHPETEVAGVE